MSGRLNSIQELRAGKFPNSRRENQYNATSPDRTAIEQPSRGLQNSNTDAITKPKRETVATPGEVPSNRRRINHPSVNADNRKELRHKPSFSRDSCGQVMPKPDLTPRPSETANLFSNVVANNLPLLRSALHCSAVRKTVNHRGNRVQRRHANGCGSPREPRAYTQSCNPL